MKKILENSYKLEKEEPNKSAYWHLGQLRNEIKYFDPLPLDWKETSVSAKAMTAIGEAEIYRSVRWRLRLPNRDLQIFESAQEAKDEIQRLHNEQVLVWLG